MSPSLIILFGTYVSISGWVATKAICPLCKKKVPGSNLPVQPLFLDIAAHELIETNPTMTTARQPDGALCASLKQQLAMARQKLEDQRRQFDREKEDYIYKIKKYKEYKDIKR
jgi:hypothetical protein